MQTVYLNGGIAQFGTKWSTNCANIGDVFKLIDCQTPGFRRYLIDAAENNIGFEIQRGEEFLENEEELLLSLRNEDIIITEVPTGAKDGATKIVVAAAILVVIGLTGGTAGFFPNIGNAIVGGGANPAHWAARTAAMVAVNLGVVGVTQLLAPGPEADGFEENDSYLFNGPITSSPEGLPVPVLYGELIVGGMPISVRYKQVGPFAHLNDIDTTDAYVNFISGTANTSDPIKITETDMGSGTVGSDTVAGSTTFPSAEDTDTDSRNDAEDEIDLDEFISYQYGDFS